jgi:hypothetical protein
MLISQKNFCVNSHRVLCPGGFERAIAPSPSKTDRFNQLAVKGRLMKAGFEPTSDAILFW